MSQQTIFLLHRSFQGLCVLVMSMQRSGDNPVPVILVIYPFSVTEGALFADYHSSSQLALLAVNTKT